MFKLKHDQHAYLKDNTTYPENKVEILKDTTSNEKESSQKEKQLQTFLNTLYRQGERINLRFINGRAKNQFITYDKNSPDTIKKYISNFNQTHNCYFSPIPRKENDAKMHGRINTLFVDIDSKDFPNNDEYLEHKKQLSQNLAKIELRPTFVINSGHGLHIYWVLKEDKTITKEQWVELQKALILYCKADPSRKNPNDLLRMPTSINIKDIDNPKECIFEAVFPEHIYSIEQFHIILAKYRENETQSKIITLQKNTNFSTDILQESVIEVLTEFGSGLFNNYNDFLNLSYAFKSANIPYDVLDAILQQSDNHNYSNNLKIYNQLTPTTITFKTAYWYAEQCNQGGVKKAISRLNKEQKKKQNNNIKPINTPLESWLFEINEQTGKPIYITAPYDDLLVYATDTLKWRVCILNDNIFIYEKTKDGFYLEIDHETAMAKIQELYPLAHPNTIKNLFLSLRKQTNRFVELHTRPNNKIPMKNGIFNLETGNLEPYKEDDFYLNPIKDNYKKSDENKIKYFLKIVSQWVVPKHQWDDFNKWQSMNLEDIEKELHNNVKWFIEFLAYMIFNHPNQENLWANFYGRGANGKSLCIYMLEKIIGENKCNDIDLGLINRFTAATTHNKWLITAKDSSPYLSTEGHSFIKSFTGDKRITIEPKGKQSFSANVTGKLIVSTNDLIKSKDKSQGWYRRLVTIPFPNQFEIDEKIFNNIDNIISDIRNYLLELAHKYIANNQKLNDTIPTSFKQLHKDTQESNNTVLAWVEDTFLDKNNNLDTELIKEQILGKSIKEIYNLYVEWHKEEFGDEEKITPSLKKFGGGQGILLANTPLGDLLEYHRTSSKRELRIKQV